MSTTVRGITYPGDSATLYAIIRKTNDGTVWDGSAMSTWANGSIGTYDLPMTAQGGDLYTVTIPTTLPTGAWYRFEYYEQAGASPATSDLILSSEELYWDGGTATSFGTGSYLTTLATVKLYAGETTTNNDTKYTNALAAATAFIQKWCDQDFLAASYTEYHNGGCSALTLFHRPITAITRVASRPVTALYVQNSGTSVGRATVTVTSTGVTLTSTASGSTTTTTILFASYLTISQLATQISTVSGWTATADALYGLYNSSDLVNVTNVSASAADGPAQLHIYADEIPYMRLDADRGVLFGDFSAVGFKTIQVKYSAGSGTVPDDVQQACAALATALYRKSNVDSFFGGERIGDYSYSNAQQVSGVFLSDLNRFAPDAAMLLQAYRRIGLT